MIRQEDYLYRRFNQALDVMLAFAALVGAHYLGQWVLRPYVFPTLIERSSLGTHTWVYVVFPPMVLLFQHLNGQYSSGALRSTGQLLRANTLSAFYTAGFTVLVSYLTYEGGVVSRMLLLGGSGALALGLCAKALLMRRYLRRQRLRGRYTRRLLLVGSGPTLRQFIELVRSHPVWGFELVGVASDDPDLHPGQTTAHVPVVERLHGLVPWLESNRVDEVVFVPARTPLADLRVPLEACELMGIRTRLSLNFFEQRIGFLAPTVDAFEGIPVVTYSPARDITDWRLLVKYTLDRVGAAIALLLLSPVMIGIAIIIWLTSPRGAPIFFGQRRSGLNGREFTCWKFRTMHVDAEARLAELMKNNEMSGPVFKMRHDPRVTPIGRFLRKSSLDELPQLWNVLTGEMSLVGPRPPIPAEVARYDLWQRRRLSMKPGITCIWQVSGRNLLDFDTWMRMDLEYIDHWSLWLDFRILLRTVRVVITGHGAM